MRIGRYGPFLELQRDGDRLTASIPEEIAPADLSNEEAVALLEKSAEGPQELGEGPGHGEAQSTFARAASDPTCNSASKRTRRPARGEEEEDEGEAATDLTTQGHGAG